MHTKKINDLPNIFMSANIQFEMDGMEMEQNIGHTHTHTPKQSISR